MKKDGFKAMRKTKKLFAAAFAALLFISVFCVASPTARAVSHDTVATGTKYLVNVASGKYLCLKDNADKDYQNIQLANFNKDSVALVMKIKSKGSGLYAIQPAESTARYLNIAKSRTNTNVSIHDGNGSKYQGWYFSAEGNGIYTIRNATNESLCLNATGKSNGSNVTVTTYKKGNLYQQWRIENFSLKKDGDDPAITEYGMDVSQFQGTINWQAAKEYGIKFVILRAGWVGTVYNSKGKENANGSFLDPSFEQNYKAAKAQGIKVGAYVYSYSVNAKEATDGAKKTLQWIKGKDFDYPIYFDIEDPDYQEKLTTKVRTDMCVAFMNTVQAAGYESGVYASEDWFNNKLDCAKIAAVGSTWLAKWPKSDQANESHGEYQLWQYRSDGKVAGIAGNVDMNVSYDAYKSYSYTGGEIRPKYSYYNADMQKLTEGRDYTLGYENNVNVGLASVTATGIGNYAGKFSQKKYFRVIPRWIARPTFTLATNWAYTGVAVKPAVKAVYNGKTLSSKDYTLTYKNNKNVGTATITVKGKGNFFGTKTLNFKISKFNLKNAKVSGVKNKVYSGKARTLSLTVKTPAGVTLKNGTDYTVSYKNNVNFGTATVTIKGKGKNCTGSYTKSFNIVPQTPTAPKATKKSRTSISIKWGHSDYATRYQVYRATSQNGKYTYLYSTDNRWQYTYTNKKLSPGTQYYYKVRSYKKVGKTKIYSGWSSVLKTNTEIYGTTATLKANKKAKTVQLSLKPTKDASGYHVYMATSKNGKYKKLYSGKKPSFTATGLKNGKTYYFKVRTYKKAETGYIYSSYSERKSVRL